MTPRYGAATMAAMVEAVASKGSPKVVGPAIRGELIFRLGPVAPSVS